MALAQLKLKRSIDEKRKEIEKLRGIKADFEKREAELEQSVEEAETEEDKATIDEAVEALEKEENEAGDVDGKITNLEKEVTELEENLRTIEQKTEEPAPEEGRGTEKPQTRTIIGGNKMIKRFKDMDMQTRDAFFANEAVASFMQNVRSLIKEKRSVSGADLTIPQEFLGVLRQNITTYSKLLKYVNLVKVNGKARQTISGNIPEAVWTEACAKLNELDFVFNAVDVDAYKVGGFIPICNAVLEDSDADLADTLMEALGAAIGRAIDKAILFGTGVKMPLGIATRLAQTTAPRDYPTTARPWADLHTSNIKNVSGTGSTLFVNITKATAAAKGKYSNGEKFWAMNGATKLKLIAEALSFNASGAIVTSVNDTMPVVGGDIVVIDDIADDTIIGGYGDEYLLAERAGTTIAQSEHVRFLEDQTVIKGTARYDGQPAIAEGFVVLGLGVDPTTTATFATDKANTEG